MFHSISWQAGLWSSGRIKPWPQSPCCQFPTCSSLKPSWQEVNDLRRWTGSILWPGWVAITSYLSSEWLRSLNPPFFFLSGFLISIVLFFVLQCQRCAPLYNDKPFRSGDQLQPMNCRPCHCHGHALSCHYDVAADDQPDEHYQGGGGVCDDCTHNTTGRVDVFRVSVDLVPVFCGRHHTPTIATGCIQLWHVARLSFAI